MSAPAVDATKKEEKSCWEYRVMHTQDLPSNLQDGLNGLGNEGWELMSVRSIDNVRIVEYIFKRNKKS